MRISDWSSDVCSSDLWDPKFGTAISDLEVETREVQGKFWHLKYPLEDGSGFIHVATTRPETMLADMAVAVHPEDERYTALIGKKIRHPITGRSEEHTSELQSLMRISYAVFCLKKKKKIKTPIDNK